MTGIIVTGHGTFPEGILSAVSLVAGKPDNTQAVNFEMGQSSEDLKDSMAKAMESLEGDEVLILADLVGGTPFNTAAALRKARADKRIKVIAFLVWGCCYDVSYHNQAGRNILFLLKMCFTLQGAEPRVDKLADAVYNG